jgi:hypothetical protein
MMIYEDVCPNAWVLIFQMLIIQQINAFLLAQVTLIITLTIVSVFTFALLLISLQINTLKEVVFHDAQILVLLINMATLELDAVKKIVVRELGVIILPTNV